MPSVGETRLAAGLRLLLAVTLLAGVAACNTVQQTVAFDDAQQAYARKQIGKGTGTVTGTAFVHARTGRTYTAGGDWVTLVPATAYAEERMRILYGDSKARSEFSFRAVPSATDEAYVALTRRVKADIHGTFVFDDVMPGRWFVAAQVHWQTYDRDIRTDVDHGFTIYEDIVVKPGETTDVVLSGH